MSERKDDKPATSPSQTAMVLSALAITPEGSLALFLKQRAAESSLGVEDLKRAREILAAIGEALGPSGEGRAIDAMWRALKAVPESAPAAEATGTAPVPSSLANAVTPSVVSNAVTPSAVATPPPAAVPMPALAALAALAPSAAMPPAPPSALVSVPAPVMSGVVSVVAPPIVSGVSAAPVPAPVAAPPPIAKTMPSPWSAPAPREEPSRPKVDFAALNNIALDEDRPATIGMDDAFEGVAALPFAPGNGEPPPPPDEDDPVSSRESSATAELDGLPNSMSYSALALPFKRAGAALATGPVVPAQTAAAPSQPGTPQPAPSQPGAPEAPAHLASLTVEQHAALCAECAVRPADTAQIQAQYNIRSDAERVALDQHWRARVAASEELMQLWRWHYARYEQWHRQRQG